MDWDDLRIVAAIREAGTFAGAGARLRLNETTVARRLTRIERGLGVRLFEAVDGRRRATPQGEAVLAHVDAMAEHVIAISRTAAETTGLSGRFRIASTPSIAEAVLAPRVGELLARHSGLTLQFLTSAENVRFSRWETDLAIRLRKPDKGDFSISKLGDFGLCLIEPIDPKNEPIVCAYPPDLEGIPEARFLEVSRITLSDVLLTSEFDVLPSSASRWL